jgi:hypothetical protein
MTDLIDRQALLAKMREAEASAADGEKRNPDDPEWATIHECYGDMIRMVTDAPSALIVHPIKPSRPFVIEPEVDNPTGWLNHYKCPECEHEWSGEWDCQVDDDCPNCGTRHISPTRSEETSDA